MPKEPLRLSKLLAQRGYCSRREADTCIENGWVQVNGEIINTLGSKVSEEDEIKITPEGQAWLQKKLSVMINKPVGYVSAQAEGEYKPAMLLLTAENQDRQPGDPKPPNRKERLSFAPAGRLDIDSKGLLILTQDGKLARQVISPDSAIEKEYLVNVTGDITAEKIKKLQFGISLDGQKLKRAKIKQTKPQQLIFVLTQGKKRQIRRMCELVDLKVVSLVRLRIGPIKLGQLKPGHWRYLSKKEVFALLK